MVSQRGMLAYSLSSRGPRVDLLGRAIERILVGSFHA